MPSSPEFLDRSRDIRIIEIFKKMKSEDPAHSDSHITVTAEIEINLQSIADSSQPSDANIQTSRIQRKHLIRYGARRICQQKLFRETDDKTSQTGSRFFSSTLPAIDHRRYIMVLDNRSRDELRKERDIQYQLCKIAGSHESVPIDIDDIRHPLKSIKGDPDGQYDSRQRNRHAEKRIDIVHRKIEDI